MSMFPNKVRIPQHHDFNSSKEILHIYVFKTLLMIVIVFFFFFAVTEPQNGLNCKISEYKEYVNNDLADSWFI